MGVAVGDIAPGEYMSKLLRDLIQISTKQIMTAITEIKLIMRTSIADEQITSRAHTRNMNSTTISNRKDRNTYDAREHHRWH